MIDVIITLDYEIYGDGTGSLKESVYEPAERLRNLFRSWGVRLVAFIEVAELQKIEACGTDSDIDRVKGQVRQLYNEGFEIGLHLHPQWVNAEFDSRRWLLDDAEYNLCTLPRPRIAEIVQGSLAYLRHLVDAPAFTPLSFRAGNWLFQPTQTAASVLAENGIRIDSSVFKGAVQHRHSVDYRPSLANGYYWQFNSDVNVPDRGGVWTEVPIYTEMVLCWKMATSKRLGFKNASTAGVSNYIRKVSRVRDLLRLRYPLKLDFCRMTLAEMTSMVSRVIRADQGTPDSYKPIVAIGHTKDLTDLQSVDAFLAFLQANRIGVATFEDIYPLLSHKDQHPSAALIN